MRNNFVARVYIFGVRAFGLLVAGYLALGLGNLLGYILFMFTSLAIGLGRGGPVLSGLVVGVLTPVLFGRRWMVLSVLLAWLIVLMSWFVFGNRVMTTGPISYPIHDQPLPAMHMAYWELATWLLLSGAASVVGQLFWRWPKIVKQHE